MGGLGAPSSPKGTRFSVRCEPLSYHCVCMVFNAYTHTIHPTTTTTTMPKPTLHMSLACFLAAAAMASADETAPSIESDADGGLTFTWSGCVCGCARACMRVRIVQSEGMRRSLHARVCVCVRVRACEGVTVDTHDHVHAPPLTLSTAPSFCFALLVLACSLPHVSAATHPCVQCPSTTS